VELSRLAGKTYPYSRPIAPLEAQAYFSYEGGSRGKN
jgi:hypothetical protein